MRAPGLVRWPPPQFGGWSSGLTSSMTAPPVTSAAPVLPLSWSTKPSVKLVALSGSTTCAMAMRAAAVPG